MKESQLGRDCHRGGAEQVPSKSPQAHTKRRKESASGEGALGASGALLGGLWFLWGHCRGAKEDPNRIHWPMRPHSGCVH